MKKFLKIIGIIIFGLGFIAYSSICIEEKNPLWIIAILICAIPLFFLCRSLRKNNKEKSTSNFHIEKSQMRKSITKNQIEDSIRIMNDCINLMKTTKNLDTFFSRWELGKQHALFLKQCEDCNAYKGKPTSESFFKFFFNDDMLLKLIISKTYIDTVEKANQLKTDSGKAKRFTSYFQKLNEYSHLFTPEIDEYINNLKKGQ